MKIALVSQSYYPRFGGVTEHVAHTAGELRRRGHEVTVVTGRPPGYRSADPPDVVRVGTSILVPFQGAFVDLTIGPTLRRDLRRLWGERTFDLVHVHQPLARQVRAHVVQAHGPGFGPARGEFRGDDEDDQRKHGQAQPLGDRSDLHRAHPSRPPCPAQAGGISRRPDRAGA